MPSVSDQIVIALEEYERDMIDGSEDSWREIIAHDLQCIGLLYRYPKDRDNGYDAEVLDWAEIITEMVA